MMGKQHNRIEIQILLNPNGDIFLPTLAKIMNLEQCLLTLLEVYTHRVL